MPLTPEQTRQDLLAAASRVLDSRARLFESLNLDNSGFWGLSARDLGLGDTPGWELPGGPGSGLTYLDRQKRGEYIPAFLNASQLRLFRQRIRQLCLSNPIALNVVSAHQSYGIGEGFRYEASASKIADRSGEEHPGVEALVERVQRVIDAFTEHNELALREAEISSRVDIDGEAILRLFPRESGLLSVRTVEPEHVWFPGGDSGDDSFGVRTAPGDVETPIGYWVVTGIPDEGAQPELIDASEIWHLKSQETPRTSKRGFSDFFAVHTELVASSELLKAVVAMAKARSKIAWVEQMEGATVDVAMALANSQAAATATDPATGQTVNMERYPAGSVLRTNNEIVFPAGNVSAADYLEVLNADLRIIAARFSMPEYMLSSDASNANYSSTLVAESPFVKKMKRRQSYFGKALGSNRHDGPTRSLVWRQVANCVEIGMLPPEVFRLVDIQVTGPTLTVRDVAKEAQVDQILHGMGAKSITTIQLQQSLDPDEEGANIAKEKKAAALNADPAILPSVPGMNGQEQMTPPQEGPEPSPLGESFTGRKQDKLGRTRCYSDGKPTPCHADKAGGDANTPAPDRAHTVASARVERLLSSPASARPADVAKTVLSLNKLTKVELKALASKHGLKRLGGDKKALAEKIAKEASRVVGVRHAADREARQAGVDPAEMASVAREMRSAVVEFNTIAALIISSASAAWKSRTGKALTRNHPAFRGGDPATLGGEWEEIAQQLARHHPDLLGSPEDSTDNARKLYDLFLAGAPRMPSRGNSYAEAIEYLRGRPGGRAAKSQEEIPF